MSGFSEDALAEAPAMALLAELGWTTVNAYAETFGPDGTLGRDGMSEVYLRHRVADAIARLNPTAPEPIRTEALDTLVRTRTAMEPVHANRTVHELLRDGYVATWTDDHGDEQTERIRYLDFDHAADNDLLAVQQFWIQGELYRRRADIVLFVNGVPLVLVELKAPHVGVQAAYDDNISDYRDAVPELFVPNGFVIASNSIDTRVGASFAPWEFFGDWKWIDAAGTVGRVSLETTLRGTCAPDRLLDLIENFVAYSDSDGRLVKKLAKYHQYFGVNTAIENIQRCRAQDDTRLGVFWHTQGSGKTMSMLWMTQKILRRLHGKWTFVMVTDRTELDEQLHREFAAAGAIDAAARVHATSGSHLRELLAADHRYVFTLIQKFRPADGETAMPVLSDRSDVIVITDEAHRSQYDTLALNMRAALPNAGFMGFTGTPLMDGEERTREQFGDYVSIYNFGAAIADGATVPLYYENRIPQLQITNENFSRELIELLDDAELDDAAEGQLARRFGKLHALLTRPERLRTIAADLVEHFMGRGHDGKAMVVAIDKATAVTMYDLVQEHWAAHLDRLRGEAATATGADRDYLQDRIAWMESTDMAVVVSPAQNELRDMAVRGADIRPHRERMVREPLDRHFKDPANPLRIVFVCAMWMTGFDAPAVSTIYLDRPMRNHTLMQTIARANRVFPNKDSGTIVDYIGVFRNLEAALAIYGAATGETAVDAPIQDKDDLIEALEAALDDATAFCHQHGVDLETLAELTGFDQGEALAAAIEVFLANEEVRDDLQQRAALVRRLFKAVLPDSAAGPHQRRVAALRAIAQRLSEVTRPPKADVDDIAEAVDKLLTRSVGAEEYLIRSSTTGPSSLIDLSLLDVEALAARIRGRERAEVARLAQLLKARAVQLAAINPTRHDLVQRIEELIAEYNAGSRNTNEELRRLIELSRALTDEEQRSVREGLDEDELALFDLLTKPDPTLTAEERETVKRSARRLLARIVELQVMDWRTKAATAAAMREGIGQLLDAELPEAYTPEIFDRKVGVIYDHVLTRRGHQ
jgi:type I restriction enzyme R subunit